jgi:hypothetical protein
MKSVDETPQMPRKSGRQDLNLPSASRNQRVAKEDTPIDTLDPHQRAQLCEVETAWTELPQAVREAILAIVRNTRKMAPTADRFDKVGNVPFADCLPVESKDGRDRSKF